MFIDERVKVQEAKQILQLATNAEAKDISGN
jgi:hypothetical protein